MPHLTDCRAVNSAALGTMLLSRASFGIASNYQTRYATMCGVFYPDVVVMEERHRRCRTNLPLLNFFAHCIEVAQAAHQASSVQTQIIIRASAHHKQENSCQRHPLTSSRSIGTARGAEMSHKTVFMRSCCEVKLAGRKGCNFRAKSPVLTRLATRTARMVGVPCVMGGVGPEATTR